MSRFLVVTWDGAGNLLPTLGLARRLSKAGHDVRMLGHRSIHDRCGSDGWRFHPFEHTMDFDSARPSDGEDEMALLARQLWFTGSVSRDVGAELSREPADVLVGDCLLMGALSAGQATRLPTVALFHAAFAQFRGGPLVDMLSGSIPAVNALREDLGLRPIARFGDVHDACALSLVFTPKEFEPEVPLPSNVRFVGPILDGPPLLKSADEFAVPSGTEPLVVVSFSTSNQGQLAVLRRFVEALASLPARVIITTGPAIDPASLPSANNVQVVRFVPHERLFPRASLVVTHAGLGTVMTALAHGVRLLCVPLGRDQFFNASRVEALGAGRVVAADADPGSIRAAVQSLLHDDSARHSAARFADVIAKYGNGARALSELEHLALGATLAP